MADMSADQRFKYTKFTNFTDCRHKDNFSFNSFVTPAKFTKRCHEPLTTRLKFGERCFSHAGPRAWNELPTELQDLTEHSAFRCQLKTFLFERAFSTQ